MRICLVAAFPPSRRQLNEYSFHIAREIQRNPNVELTILADELSDYNFATDSNGQQIRSERQPEIPGFNVVRCWKFGSLATPVRLLNTIRRLKPDVVWFNLVFSSFGTPETPFAAFAGLSAPALVRAAGFYTHITLHHIIEHCDLPAGGVRRGEKIYRMGTEMATRALLKADSVSVLLSAYRRTLLKKYSARNVVLGTHGIFTTNSHPLNFSLRNNPESRILAIGHWGTYKRLELLMEAFPKVLEKIPKARLIVAGANHHTRAGYWESIRASQAPHLPIEFRGYVPDEDIPELFRTSSVLVMPYDSSTGSSGPAHQACEFGLPIVCADIPDFRCMAADDEMAINFYQLGNAGDLADKLVTILQSEELQRQLSEHNCQAGIQMTMGAVVRNYLRWFQLHQCKRTLGRVPAEQRRALVRPWPLRVPQFRPAPADPDFPAEEQSSSVGT
ncbi:MAG TPA: glycosyltransferase [Candidatus Sulfotelmatobacter sp.]|nr:glycosyltransferase [Candidatus Sulfotelmatobacter sp.]